jgi:4-hydroxythreonine-4-phosphate dehydrogenase
LDADTGVWKLWRKQEVKQRENSDSPVPIACTPGDPAGIGPDLVLMLAAERSLGEIIVLASGKMLADRALELGLNIELIHWPGRAVRKGQLAILEVACPVTVEAGIADPAYAPYVLETLDLAIEGCLEGNFSAMVTGPVNKAVISEAGVPFSGHTEYLAERTGAARAVMMLATEGLRVALLTTHMPLSDVSATVSRGLVEQVLRIIDDDFRKRIGITRPRILVCGLNPHAGEGGHLGREEIESIIPAINALREEGMDVSGPLPADTLFTRHHLDNADVVLTMYHDQGLPVLKYKGFGRATNITLGLPIVRTSVDHGTAFELAGSGRIETGSMLESIDVARAMAGSES